MFDEQPDGDPHGECAAEIHRLEAQRDELLALLAEARTNDRTAMHYLGQIRGFVGGADFPDMVKRVAALVGAASTAQPPAPPAGHS